MLPLAGLGPEIDQNTLPVEGELGMDKETCTSLRSEYSSFR